MKNNLYETHINNGGAIVYDDAIYEHIEGGFFVVAKTRVYVDDENQYFTAIPLSGDEFGQTLEGWSVGDFKELDEEDRKEEYLYLKELRADPKLKAQGLKF